MEFFIQRAINMATSASKKTLQHLRATDLRAVAQLATQATQGVARMAEGVHQSVWGTLGVGKMAAGQTTGLTGLVYQSVRGVTQLVAKGLDSALSKLEPFLEPSMDPKTSTVEREAVLAALNGVLGDHLAASGNPLATQMTLRFAGQALDWHAMPTKAHVTGKVLLMVHGLCMNDLQWAARHQANKTSPAILVDHGQALATALGYTPVYARYNTGLHTSENGHALSEQLSLLAAHWPTPITVLVHSMGGLVTRSAVHSAQQSKAIWLPHLKNIVFLGTPHHGAPLEKAGNWVDIILGSTPYSKPFAKLGQLRSSGITDLRFGHVQDSDWQGQDRFSRKSDNRTPTPLPEGVACYTVAATIATKSSVLADRLVGDGLVSLPSAMGQHTDAARSLQFAKASQHIAYRTNHMQLLSRPDVTKQLLKWLSPA
jgi:pimeloyl-ACP methyl ester carboxylesterase